jgi:hypothetical protein
MAAETIRHFLDFFPKKGVCLPQDNHVRPDIDVCLTQLRIAIDGGAVYVRGLKDDSTSSLPHDVRVRGRSRRFLSRLMNRKE